MQITKAGETYSRILKKKGETSKNQIQIIICDQVFNGFSFSIQFGGVNNIYTSITINKT